MVLGEFDAAGVAGGGDVTGGFCSALGIIVAAAVVPSVSRLGELGDGGSALTDNSSSLLNVGNSSMPRSFASPCPAICYTVHD